MPSPFPGMDPYLEDPWLWSDFHLTFIVSIRAELNRRLPPGYVSFADRYVWVHEPETETKGLLGKPDIFMTEAPVASQSAGATATAAPVEIVLPSLTEKGNPYLKIVDRNNRRVVTVIELLSTANKTRGKDREAFLWKRGEYLATGVNLVEMDLLRKGERLPWGTPPTSTTDYYVMVSRAAERPKAGVWPFSVRDPLPMVPIPLNPGTPDVNLLLRPCLDQAYDDAGYARELDYRLPPNPPLDEPDATWARELLAGKQTEQP